MRAGEGYCPNCSARSRLIRTSPVSLPTAPVTPESATLSSPNGGTADVIRVAVLNGFTALGIPVTKVAA